MIERPMLAATVAYDTLEKVEWPAMCSPKIDGIRCLMHPELGPITRSFKTLPNVHVFNGLQGRVGGSHFDGELIAVDRGGNVLPYNATQSAMMSRNGQPYYRYLVFDCFEHPDWDFVARYTQAKSLCFKKSYEEIQLLEHQVVKDMGEFLKFADTCVAQGYEGSIIRAPVGTYKSGRSTLRQGWLLKYKQWADAEGAIIGFEELYHNANPDQRDKFDLAKRSSHKDNMIPAGTLGALILQTEWGELRVGTGFDAASRQLLWDRNMTEQPKERVFVHGHSDMGRIVTFKYQPHGMQDLPRFPVFKGFREGT